MSQLQTRKSQLDYILIDGSSSMADKWLDSLQAVDAYIAGLREAHIASHIYIHVFTSGHQIDLVAFDDGIENYSPITGRLELPAGMTPLYDAVGIMARRMRDLDPQSGAITIVTDGEEMGSNHTDLNQAKAYLDWCRAKGWPITFIGADFSNSSQAAALGAGPQEAIGVQKKLLPAAARNLAKKRAHHARTGDDIAFTSDEQQQFGGYLAAPK